ncbi:MAG: SDR family NAD(P)-dependent oxidoreductase, partial [Anaerolineales bacterium]|nr:SDR family NAD(P)-dependent oxidoreductase [Anaerolineales bacterium]
MMKTVLITGATSGLGLEMARLYHQQGARLVLIGRRPLAQLQEDLFTEERYCQVDLGLPEAAEVIKNWLDERAIETVDVLIHNAAVGYYGTVADQPTPSMAQLIQVNVKAPIAVTHALLPRVTAVRGQLVFVGSVASVLPTAEYVTYTASKAALDGFARSLRIELGEQASVLVLHPGATHTGMHEKIGISREKLNWEKFPAAAVVAQHMVAVIERGKGGRVALGLGNKLLRRVGLTAGAIVERMMRLAARPERHLAQENSKRPHVVITGVAEGIGKELALRFAWAGFEVTGVDVNVGGALETKRQIAQRG